MDSSVVFHWGLVDALILAAGRGSRLGGGNTPKCLVEVGGRPLLSHQLKVLRDAGVGRVTLVVGHCHELVRSVVDEDVEIVHNERYAETNSLYSFSLARGPVWGELLVLNCDALFPRQVLDRLFEAPKSALAFDSGSGGKAEHMKVSVRGGQLVQMSKNLSPRKTHGENVGLIRLTATAADSAFGAAEALVRGGREQDWLGEAINAIAPEHSISCVDVAGLPWVEIDFPHDLAFARARTWPAIEALHRPRTSRRAIPLAAGTESAFR